MDLSERQSPSLPPFDKTRKIHEFFKQIPAVAVGGLQAGLHDPSVPYTNVSHIYFYHWIITCVHGISCSIVRSLEDSEGIQVEGIETCS